MKRHAFLLLTLGLTPLASSQLLRDSFETGHTLGNTPANWDTTFDPNPANLPLQQNLFTVEASVGQAGSQGLSLDVTKAKLGYQTKLSAPTSGKKLTLTFDFRLTTSGVVLDGDTNGTPPAELPNGVNAPIIGAIVSPLPLWEEGPNWGIQFTRREDDIWGLRVPGTHFVEGWLNNSVIGLAPGLTPSTSDWIMIKLKLTDTGTQWEGFAEIHHKENGTLCSRAPASPSRLPLSRERRSTVESPRAGSQKTHPWVRW